jgi:uncharacterized protein DUF4340
MNRTQWILGGTLVVQCLALALIYSGSQRAGAGEPHPLVPALDPAAVARIEIRGDAGKTLNLAKSGTTWTLAEADGYPADGSKVETLLSDLKKLQVRRPIVTSSRYHETLKVTDAGAERRIRVYPQTGNDPVVDLLVGSSPSYGATNVRVAGDDRVYEVRDLRTYDIRPDPGSWIDRKLVDMPAEDVTKIAIHEGSTTIGLSKSGTTWTMTQPAGDADAAKVDAWLRGILGILATEPAGKADKPELGFESPAATVELTKTKDNATETVVLRIGGSAPGAEGQRYARRDGASHAVILSSWDAEKLLTKKPADFKK